MTLLLIAQTNSRLLLINSLFPSQSRQTKLYSNATLVVSLPPKNAEPNLTMESLLSDTAPKMVRSTSLSRTHGDLLGVLMATSRLALPQAQVFVVSTRSHLPQQLTLLPPELRVFPLLSRESPSSLPACSIHSWRKTNLLRSRPATMAENL